MITKVLIANRGEIAVRIVRSCHEMGIGTVAVYSTVDRTAAHVLLADEAVEIGPAAAAESYLDHQKIISAALKVGADAIHPGYGFLSENATFAEDVAAAGIIWIGPPPSVIAQMGDKLAARKLALKAGLPILPGLDDPANDEAVLLAAAKKIGYPVLVKAAGGGGGKGMRIVQSASEMAQAVEIAASEALAAFGDGRVYLEKYLEGPHHIEVQVFADEHGNAVSLGERECSIQRRYQKIVEETPSPFISADLRENLERAALDITRMCDYVGAGTVEFLVDKHQNFYFLEMNTRLQVEHPITELVTGIDLVSEQLRVASGEPLTFSQNDVEPRGHAIECRIYAEDGFDGFSPSMGTILELTEPGGPGIRLDHGIRAGQEITPYYDPLLGKFCSWGRTRGEAIRRMDRALEELRIVGLSTTIPFCRAVMNDDEFVAGRYDTHFIVLRQSDLNEWNLSHDSGHLAVAALGAVLHSEDDKPKLAGGKNGMAGESGWLKAGRRQQVTK